MSKVLINTEELFWRAMDQTMFDLRDLPAEAGRPLTLAEEDIFLAQLHSLANRAVLDSGGKISGFAYNRVVGDIAVTLSVEKGKEALATQYASMLTDVLLYGMLHWWYSSKNPNLAAMYLAKYSEEYSRLVIGLRGIGRSQGRYY